MVLFLFSTVLQFLQCPARWTGLQLVISPGPNPLPAVVHLKYSVSGSKVEDDEFYGLDIVDKFDDEAMAKHVYNDPVQLAVRIILCRSLIKVFTTFRYEEDPNTKDFAARFPCHHEQMLVVVIDLVNDEFNRYTMHIVRRLEEIEEEGDKDAHRFLSSQMNMLRSAQAVITTGNIAKLLLQCTDTFRAKKNWNSHGASVGSAICQLASILSQMESASVNELDANFNVIIPQGNIQTGSKHGDHNVCYTEYMCSQLEPRVMGNSEVYLNLDIFKRDNHAAKVRELFEETVPGYPHAPAPRPTKAHTFDFNCTYRGARILDGECKASATKAEIGYMVLHSTEQLVTQEVAMSMLTTSHQMAFYKTVKMKRSGHLKTTVCRTHTYELGHVKDLNCDTYKDEPHIQKPPKCYSAGQKLLVENDDDMIEAWKHLRAEPKMFIHAVMHAVDILAEHFSSLDLKDVKRKRNQAFNKGWKEPEFRTTTVRDLQTNREIQNPDRFIHCKATMEPQVPGAREDQLHADLEEYYRKALQEAGLSEECRKFFEETMNSHKRRKTSK